MTATTTNLTQDLQAALTRQAGFDRPAAVMLSHLLPPAGQHALLEQLHSNPDVAVQIASGWRDDVAEHLRITTADAETVKDQFRAVTR